MATSHNGEGDEATDSCARLGRPLNPALVTGAEARIQRSDPRDTDRLEQLGLAGTDGSLSPFCAQEEKADSEAAIGTQ